MFVGTRVPLATLLDDLEAGQPLSEFLEDFSTVNDSLANALRGGQARAARQEEATRDRQPR